MKRQSGFDQHLCYKNALVHLKKELYSVFLILMVVVFSLFPLSSSVQQ